MKKNTIKFICSEHGEVEFSHFQFAIIHLSCGCWWESVGGMGLFFTGKGWKEQELENEDQNRI